jgi:hypothetical protein
VDRALEHGWKRRLAQITLFQNPLEAAGLSLRPLRTNGRWYRRFNCNVRDQGSGWGTGIRTPISRSKVCCPAVGRSPNAIPKRRDTWREVARKSGILARTLQTRKPYGMSSSHPSRGPAVSNSPAVSVSRNRSGGAAGRKSVAHSPGPPGAPPTPNPRRRRLPLTPGRSAQGADLRAGDEVAGYPSPGWVLGGAPGHPAGPWCRS